MLSSITIFWCVVSLAQRLPLLNQSPCILIAYYLRVEKFFPLNEFSKITLVEGLTAVIICILLKLIEKFPRFAKKAHHGINAGEILTKMQLLDGANPHKTTKKGVLVIAVEPYNREHNLTEHVWLTAKNYYEQYRFGDEAVK